MTDIVERLRAEPRDGLTGEVRHEAADEIERLRAEHDKERYTREQHEQTISGLCDEIERLRTALRTIETGEWHAEIERLREQYDFQVDANRSLVEACGKSENENGRLRAALQKIADLDHKSCEGLYIARRALEGK